MTADDVGKLTEQTHDLMESTLQSISASGPSSTYTRSATTSKPGQKASSADSTEPSQSTAPVSEQDGLRKRNQEGSSGSEESSRVVHLDIGSESQSVQSKGEETTEDEMDEDAVLIKRPATKAE